MADASGAGVDPQLLWYRQDTKNTTPFILSHVLSSKAGSFHRTAAFPWFVHSMDTLWDGGVTEPQVLQDWKTMVHEWAGSIAVGGTGRLFVFQKRATSPLAFNLPDENTEIVCVAWALNRDAPTNPLIVFSALSVIYIIDIKTRQIIGSLRGHGGPITSIAVHPRYPYLFGTTSKDFTTRIYDLTLRPSQRPNNPIWLPGTIPSLSGPAHGLQMSESEGNGFGRCVVVLVGGRSGGHKGAVLCAAFHETAPLIATCGMDRAVKIWRLPPRKPESLAREDKPLFSTDLIHKARVLSITWLSSDTLLSHSAPALMRQNSGDDLDTEAGTVVIWRWLGFDRFVPPGKPIQKTIRGCASDYRGSESFKVLSAYHLPLAALNLHVFASHFHDPLILIPMGGAIRVMNITHFLPRTPPPFPLASDDEVVELTKRIRLSPADDEESDSQPVDEDAEVLCHLIDAVGGWDVSTGLKRFSDLSITACEVAFGGGAILGISDNGMLLIWCLACR